MISPIQDGLKDAAVINIGRPEAKNHFFKRVLHLTRNPLGRCVIPDLGVAFADRPMAARPRPVRRNPGIGGAASKIALSSSQYPTKDKIPSPFQPLGIVLA